MEKVMNMTYASSLTDLCEVNSSFDRGVLRVAYHGENKNKSSISKQTFENCIRTMYNCPIVCNYDRETDTLGGHDMAVVRDANGALRVINQTQPLGVVPESARYWWGEVEEEDGTVHEYLFTEALLWKRQEAYRKIKKDGITAQSMEITVRDGERIDGVLHIKDFEFTAFALIGVTPCFESAGLEMFSSTDFKQQLSEMMNDLKESFSMVNRSNEVDDTYPNNDPMEGGEKVLHDKEELTAELAAANEDAVSESEEQTAKFEAMQDEQAGNAPEENGENAAKDFALTSNVVEAIRMSLESATIEREWGTCARYWFVDCDFEAQEVYCWDTEDWLLYGFRYAMNGDNAVIDFDSKQRKKYAIVDFDEGEQESPFAPVFGQMEDALHGFKLKEEAYQAASDTITSMETELKELRQFKADAESEALKSARDEVFARFEDLVGVEAFEELRENCEQYSDMSALEEKCYAIRGRVGTVAKFSNDEKAPRLKVVKEQETIKEPYGGIFARYGIEAE